MTQIDAMSREKSQHAYYLLMAAAHDAEARSCELLAAALSVDPYLDAAKAAEAVAVQRDRAATYHRLAADYRHMAGGGEPAQEPLAVDAGTRRAIPCTADCACGAHVVEACDAIEPSVGDVFTVPARAG